MVAGLTLAASACSEATSRPPVDASTDDDAQVIADTGQHKDGLSKHDTGSTDGQPKHDTAKPPPVDPRAPRIFYTDLTSGSNTGGQSQQGAFVTLYGQGFGASRGKSTVTVGGGEAAAYPIWTKTKVTLQLGAKAKTGDIVVHRAGYADSNILPFTVRPGDIFFVSKTGSDSADGSYAHPLRTLPAGKKKLKAGDILYAMDGVTQKTSDGPNASLCLSKHYQCNAAWGTAQAPIAIVAYPGAHVTVGCKESGCPQQGLRIYAPYWTVAGLSIVGSAQTYAAAVSIEKAGSEGPSFGQRLVANDITGGYYGVTLSVVKDCKVLGNHVHDTPHSAIYHGGWNDSANVEIAWNRIHDLGDRAFGIKAYGHTKDDHLTGLWIHHNTVFNTIAAAILVGGSDGHVPWVYDARIENNVIWNVSGQWTSGIRIGNSGVDETELDVVIVHNTVVGCTHALEISACKTARVQNNLFVQTSGTYLHGKLDKGLFTLDHNGYFGGTSVPTEDKTPIPGDPRFVNAASHDYHLSAGSPAIDTGAKASVPVDRDGVPRPQGAGFDVGAYEFLPPKP
ncbi:MAG: IPT/TIG domain-containing protein [Deltaproteobacteria bacterium]|nr:IPT/TIG domain-containing protein [Deltaproteobacteria bacterium]